MDAARWLWSACKEHCQKIWQRFNDEVGNRSSCWLPGSLHAPSRYLSLRRVQTPTDMILVLILTLLQAAYHCGVILHRKLVIRQFVKAGEIRQQCNLAVRYHFLDIHFSKTKLSVDPEYDTCAMFVQMPNKKLCRLFLTSFIFRCTSNFVSPLTHAHANTHVQYNKQETNFNRCFSVHFW